MSVRLLSLCYVGSAEAKIFTALQFVC